MSAITKEQLIEDLKASTQNSSGMFEIGEDTICNLMSMLTAHPAPVSAPDEMTDAADLEFQIDMLEGFDANSDDKYNTQLICWLKELQRRRAAMLHGAEHVTDNTNQQFESLSRGDK